MNYPLFITNPELVPERSGHSASLINKTLFLFGGSQDRTNEFFSIDLLDATNPDYQGIWNSYDLENIEGRGGHTATVLNNNLLIFGGYNKKRNVLGDISFINTDTLECFVEEIQPKNTIDNLERRWHSMEEYQNKLFIYGGWNSQGALGDLIVYDIEKKKWIRQKTKQQDSPTARRWHESCRIDNNIFIHGGYDGSTTSLSDLWLYNLETETWYQNTTIPIGRCRHSMAILDPKRIALFGGYSGKSVDNIVNEIEILYLDQGRVETVKRSGDYFGVASRAGCSFSFLEENLSVVFGGYDHNRRELNDLYLLNRDSL